MTTAYSYLRFSTPEQSLGDSARRQAEKAEAYAAKHGLILDVSLRDEGISGFKGANRIFGALSRFLEMATAGRIPRGSYLLVENFDRLSREHAMTAMGLLGQLVEAEINVVTLSNNKIYNKETLAKGFDLFEALFEMMRSHAESQRKSELVGAAWMKKRGLALTTGKAQTRQCPGWIEKVGDAYMLIPERVAIVREIFRRLANGEGGGLIAADLNRRQIPTWGVRKRRLRTDPKPTGPGRWHDSYIQKMRTNKAVIGVGVVKGGQEIAGYFPAAITEEDYWAARIASEARRTGDARNRGLHVRNLLQGLGKCVRCNSSMIYLDKGERSSGPYLQCTGVTDGTSCDNKFKWNYARMEMTLPFTIGAAGRTRIAEALDPNKSHADRVAQAQVRVADAERRWTSFLALIDGDPGENIKQEMKLRDAALTDARKALADLETQDVVRTGRQDETLSLAEEIKKFRIDIDRRRMIAQRLMEMIERIDCDGDRAIFRFRHGGIATYRGVATVSTKSNRGWFVDGKNKLGDGVWKNARPGK